MRTQSRNRGVGARQRQGKRQEGKTRKKSEQVERNRGTEREPPTQTRLLAARSYGTKESEKQSRKRKKSNLTNSQNKSIKQKHSQSVTESLFHHDNYQTKIFLKNYININIA